MAKFAPKVSLAASTPYELSRDAYGFAIRPHHLKLYKEFAEIYTEEEAERSARWEDFLITYGSASNASSVDIIAHDDDALGSTRTGSDRKKEEERSAKFETWCNVRSSLQPVEKALQHRFKKLPATEATVAAVEYYGSPSRYISQGSGDDSDEEFYDAERVDTVQDGLLSSSEILNDTSERVEEPCLWKEELDALVRGGVPMAFRGEVWQVFMGSSSRRVRGHFQALLTLLADGGGDNNGSGGLCNHNSLDYKLSDTGILEKWTKQIEKDLPRTFPGHPALGVDGRNALRHVLTAYARHNPKVGYCQAMNFFAGLLLLMMPEENAFWTLTGILDDCFEGYFSEEMLEPQVDQLVLEELVRSHFPRLMTHLDTLGVQVAWISGPWFLSIFVNVLPWESVLRVWDVLLYEGNRSMLFRTTLALLELHGSAIMTTKDAGDVVTMMQSLASATFDSSQLVLNACVGYQFVTESQLQQLRQKHHTQVLVTLSERLVDQSAWQKAYGPISFSSKAFAHDKAINAIRSEESEGISGQGLSTQTTDDTRVDGLLEDCEEYASSANYRTACQSNGPLQNEAPDNRTLLADLVSQVSDLKLELSKALENRRVANIRAEELETAFMELVKEDNRRLLSAKVETLEDEVAYLKRILADKTEQDQAMIQVMVRMEHEQKLTEDARQLAEEDAKAQRSALSALQVKYESAISSLKDLERRAAVAESALEATSQYQNLDNAHNSPRQSPCLSAPGEGSSGWAWSWNTSKSTNHDNLSPATLKAYGPDSNHERKGNEPQHADPPQNHGLLSRTFSMAWREKLKSNVAANDTQTEVVPGISPKPLSPQTSLDKLQ